MEFLNDIEKLNGDPALDFVWSLHDELTTEEFDELTETERKVNKILLDLVVNTDDLNEFVEGTRSMIENYRRIDEEKAWKFEQYTSEKVGSAVSYDPQTVEQFEAVKEHTWDEINEALAADTSLNDEERMYRNRMASWSTRLNPEQLSNTMMKHYMREKRSNPDRAEYFETAAKKIFEDLGVREYQETLDQVEMLPEEESEIYMDELERLVQESSEETGLEVYSDFIDLLNDADTHLELAAYTQTHIEYLRETAPGKARELEEQVKDLYVKALPTEPLH